MLPDGRGWVAVLRQMSLVVIDLRVLRDFNFQTNNIYKWASNFLAQFQIPKTFSGYYQPPGRTSGITLALHLQNRNRNFIIPSCSGVKITFCYMLLHLHYG